MSAVVIPFPRPSRFDRPPAVAVGDWVMHDGARWRVELAGTRVLRLARLDPAGGHIINRDVRPHEVAPIPAAGPCDQEHHGDPA